MAIEEKAKKQKFLLDRVQWIRDRSKVFEIITEVELKIKEIPMIPCEPDEMTEREKQIYATTMGLARTLQFLIESLVKEV